MKEGNQTGFIFTSSAKNDFAILALLASEARMMSFLDYCVDMVDYFVIALGTSTDN